MRLWEASLLFYVGVFLLCEVFRIFVRRYLSSFSDGKSTEMPLNSEVFRILLMEFIGTLQICAPIFDVNFVLDTYGLQGVFWEIIFIELSNALLLRDATADPCALFFELYKGRISSNRFKLLALFGVQFVAGYLSYFIAYQFFSLGLNPMHAAFFNEKCSADLTVSLFYGSLVEAFGVLFGKLALEFVQKLLALDEKFVCALSAFLSALITIFGMYANPIVAWALTFNCGEVTHFTHFVVYWLAPIMAYILAEEIKF